MREDILQTKLEKLENIRNSGMDPYPEKTERTNTAAEALANFDSLQEKALTLVGRVKSFRPMGNVAFAHVEDETGKIQLFLNKKGVGPEKYKLFTDAVDYLRPRPVKNLWRLLIGRCCPRTSGRFRLNTMG